MLVSTAGLIPLAETNPSQPGIPGSTGTTPQERLKAVHHVMVSRAETESAGSNRVQAAALTPLAAVSAASGRAAGC